MNLWKWNALQEFGVTSPSVQAPSSQVVNGITVPDADYAMVPNAAAQAHWNRAEEVVSAIITNMQEQYDELTSEVSEAQVYFQTYISGNQLNSNFYRSA